MRNSRVALFVAGMVLAAALAATVALAATARMNAYFSPAFKDNAYQQAAVNKVLKSWKTPKAIPAIGKKTVVISLLGRDGSLLETKFNLETENEDWDEAAKKAVETAAPFAPLPKSYPHPTLEVHWHFSVSK